MSLVIEFHLESCMYCLVVTWRYLLFQSQVENIYSAKKFVTFYFSLVSKHYFWVFLFPGYRFTTIIYIQFNDLKSLHIYICLHFLMFHNISILIFKFCFLRALWSWSEMLYNHQHIQTNSYVLPIRINFCITWLLVEAKKHKLCWETLETQVHITKHFVCMWCTRFNSR